jgi:hypothetical protein
MQSLLLTDGNERAVLMAKANVQELYRLDHQLPCNVSTIQLIWGTLEDNCSPEDAARLRGQFDVIIGCELMYYKTILGDLLNTVSSLLRSGGIFIHVHHFRQVGLQQDLIRGLETLGMATLVCKRPRAFLSSEECSVHPEWLQIVCMISGPAHVLLEEILPRHAHMLSVARCHVEGGTYSNSSSGNENDEGEGESDENEDDGEPEIRMDPALLAKYMA